MRRAHQPNESAAAFGNWGGGTLHSASQRPSGKSGDEQLFCGTNCSTEELWQQSHSQKIYFFPINIFPNTFFMSGLQASSAMICRWGAATPSVCEPSCPQVFVKWIQPQINVHKWNITNRVFLQALWRDTRLWQHWCILLIFQAILPEGLSEKNLIVQTYDKSDMT